MGAGKKFTYGVEQFASFILRSSLTVVCLLFILSAGAQTVDSNYIDWAEGKKLTYRSYKFIMPADSILNADGTMVGFAATGVRVNRDFYVKDGYLNYNIYAYVQVKGSYIMSDTLLGKSLDYVLGHEQTHFDISELYARKMRQYLNTTPDKCNEDIIEKALDSLYSEHWRKQESYDVQTFSNELMQRIWNKDIPTEIAKLNRYKASKGRCKCGQKYKQ